MPDPDKTSYVVYAASIDSDQHRRIVIFTVSSLARTSNVFMRTVNLLIGCMELSVHLMFVQGKRKAGFPMMVSKMR